MPELGPCVCDVGAEQLHEHSDFDPFACGDCDCPAHRTPGIDAAAGRNQAQIDPDGQTPLSESHWPQRAAQRVTDTAQHLDQTITSLRGTFTDPDDRLAVCALADMLEQTWPDHADSWVALVLATRRLIDATNHGRRRNIRDTIRRKVQR